VQVALEFKESIFRSASRMVIENISTLTVRSISKVFVSDFVRSCI
jgi:hypothetical protein